MRFIELWMDKKHYESWISVYSRILSDENDELYNAIFSYKLKDKVNSHDGAPPIRLNSSVVIEGLSYLLNRLKVGNHMDELESDAKAAGIIVRILCTMKKLNIEANLAKAVFVFRNYYNKNSYDGVRKAFLKSSTSIKNYYKDKYNVLHLCAAYSIYDPLECDSKLPLKTRLYKFFAISNFFMKEVLMFKKGGSDGGGKVPLVNEDEIYRIDERYLEKIPLIDIHFDFAENYVLEVAKQYIPSDPDRII